MSFADDQLTAVQAFAQTMIVVDDEPAALPVETAVPAVVKTPGRVHSSVRTTSDASQEVDAAKVTHPLDTKSLVDEALNLGLVCAVVTPTQGEEGIVARIVKATQRVDIVALDWHMNHGDSGELASEIIQEIVLQDEAAGGRLRLISIYTGNPSREQILQLVSDRVNGNPGILSKVSRRGDALTNDVGLRIVWREKAMLRENHPTAVSESQLPSELLKEFAQLSAGVLTNVALATISSMRHATHHVLSKFKADLDGPLFHHRAFLQNPKDSMDYAVSIVLSALKAEVDKAQIAAGFSSDAAIRNRIEAMKQYPDKFVFRYTDKKGTQKEVTLQHTEIVKIVSDGYSSLSDEEKRKAFDPSLEKRWGGISKAAARESFTTVFSDSLESSRRSLLDFAFLTNSRSSELSRVHRTAPPRLDLGSILFCESKNCYLLCLQATCDSVRGSGEFFFVPLEINSSSPDHVVPHGSVAGVAHLVPLGLSDSSYTKSVTVSFGKIDPSVGRVSVPFDSGRVGYFVKDVNGVEYRWLGNLKYKRALRAAQSVSQEMSRIGFDEFEPFRKM